MYDWQGRRVSIQSIPKIQSTISSSRWFHSLDVWGLARDAIHTPLVLNAPSLHHYTRLNVDSTEVAAMNIGRSFLSLPWQCRHVPKHKVVEQMTCELDRILEKEVWTCQLYVGIMREAQPSGDVSLLYHRMVCHDNQS